MQTYGGLAWGVGVKYTVTGSPFFQRSATSSGWILDTSPHCSPQLS